MSDLPTTFKRRDLMAALELLGIHLRVHAVSRSFRIASSWSSCGATRPVPCSRLGPTSPQSRRSSAWRRSNRARLCRC